MTRTGASLYRRVAGVVAVALIAFVLASGFAKAALPSDRSGDPAETAAALERISRAIDADLVDDVREQESDLRRLISSSTRRLASLEAEVRLAEDLLRTLPPAPPEGQSEAPELVERRSEFTAELSRLQGSRQLILANIELANRLLARLSTDRLRALYSGLLRPGDTVLAPKLWTEGSAQAAAFAGRFTGAASDWGANRARSGAGVFSFLAIIVALAGSLVVIGPLNRWLRTSVSRHFEHGSPRGQRIVAVTGLKVLARLLSVVLGGALVIETCRLVGVFGPSGVSIARAVWFGALCVLLVDGFSRGRRAGPLLVLTAIIFATKGALEAAGRSLTAEGAGAGAEIEYLSAGVWTMLVGVLLMVLSGAGSGLRNMRSRRAARDVEAKGEVSAGASAVSDLVDGLHDGDVQSRRTSAEARRRIGSPIALVLALGLIVAPAFGYVRLAEFVASRVYYLALVLLAAWFVRAILKEFGGGLLQRLLGEKIAASDSGSFIRFWVGAGVDGFLILVLAPITLLIGGVSPARVQDLVAGAFTGLRIGTATISLADLLLSGVVVATGVFLTRAIQRGLDRGPFAHSRMDSGVRNSLTTLAGYAGLLLTGVFAITTLGFDLSNLAIIAGALSVGIGFGLQSIVNNFVSGLILLFERPVKVGDWIVTPSGEGIVRRISVRSTEIETFDRASIIVPNAELISSTVTNWTHKNPLGRIIIKVGVSYNADPEKVRDILLDCARSHPLILRHPEPFVSWNDFGASSLDFDLRAFIPDVSSGLRVRTELRFAIFEAFKAAGIEIPFPQQDVHLKSWPRAPDPAGPSLTGASR